MSHHQFIGNAHIREMLKEEESQANPESGESYTPLHKLFLHIKKIWYRKGEKGTVIN